MSLKDRLKQIQIENERIKEEEIQSPTVTVIGKLGSQVKEELHRKILNLVKGSDQLTDYQISDIIEKEGVVFFEEFGLEEDVKRQILNELKDDLLGFGPLTRLLQNKNVSEIMVNGPDQIFVEQKGKLVLSDLKFKNDQHVISVIEKIVSPLGRRIDESSPMVDARLPDGSRVNAIVPPIALDGPSITIRKFPEKRLSVDDLLNFGSLSKEMAIFLDGCVKSRMNIVISGGTGSGKTTLLNIVSSFIPDDERIVTIEDAAELQMQQIHVVRLETRPPNIEGNGQIAIRDLVRNSLRMRPDRIVVGEVRGGEALDMLQAMNTGHDGSLATGHANSPRDMLSRLETMVLMAGMDLPVRAIREQISSAVDIIVQQTRMKDGTRKVTKITECIGMEGDTITLQDVFEYKQTGLDDNGKILGVYRPTGIRPESLDKFEEYGINIPAGLFL